MAHARHVLCGDSGSVDRYTNLVSIYNLFDRINVSRRGGGDQPRGPHLRMWILAVWCADEGDEDLAWTSQCVFVDADGDETIIDEAEDFQFNTALRRFIYNVAIGSLPEGVLSIRHRIKPQDASEWLESTYDIAVLYHDGDQTEVAAEDNDTEPAG